MEGTGMYRYSNGQISLSDFHQPMGMQLKEDNRWVKKAQMIPWDKIEEKYADLFPSSTGNVAKPLQLALGACLIQKEYGYSEFRKSMAIPTKKSCCRSKRIRICSIFADTRATMTASRPSIRPLWCISGNA